ncbi:MAG: hypothetical protein ACR2JW_17045, partial [Thermomicrobiales bacterium]
MVDQTGDWRGKLQEWLKTHPKTIPDSLRQLREEFVQHFPKLDFPQSGDVAERLGEAFDEGTGDFYHLRVRTGHAKSRVCP